MAVTREELARRLAAADRQVVILRQATRDMQRLRQHLLEERRREPGRPSRDRAPGR